LGRNDNVVNSGGIKLIPEQIEEQLSAYSSRFFVGESQMLTLGEKLVLVIEGENIFVRTLFDGLDKYQNQSSLLYL
jgi:O-succinylbenzoic acid--CoA ligase